LLKHLKNAIKLVFQLALLYNKGGNKWRELSPVMQ
jgi:hypothetical protein